MGSIEVAVVAVASIQRVAIGRKVRVQRVGRVVRIVAVTGAKGGQFDVQYGPAASA